MGASVGLLCFVFAFFFAFFLSFFCSDRSIEDEWFFGTLARADAERVLAVAQGDGTFLVRGK